MNQHNKPPVLNTIDDLRHLLDNHRANGRSIGFVPTMGYLHDGHASLMRAASANNDFTVASIFVNPLQFAADEDLDTYPRDLEHDSIIAAQAGVDCLFIPSVEEMYPHGQVLTSVTVDQLARLWEGASRPTHFAGVATVVNKLFNIVGPSRAYFGQKDFQQLAIITRMVADLSLPIDVVGCPIIREDDGLAMSSRNIYLVGEYRRAAVVLNQALKAGLAEINNGESKTEVVEAAMAKVVATEPLVNLDYAVVVDRHDLHQHDDLPEMPRLLIAAEVGSTRLIDNAGPHPT